MNMLSRSFATVALVLAATPLLAQDVVSPTGDVILTIDGSIGLRNSGDAFMFDLDMIMELPSEEIVTTTIWTEGDQSFVGVPLGDLLRAVEADGERITATAINDYAVEIPMEDAEPGRALVAYLRNGETMALRDKGPLWVVYPYSADDDFQTEVIYARSIWQLDRITVK